MKRLFLIISFFLFLVSFDNTFAAELSGQILYWDGGPAEHVEVNIKNEKGEIVSSVLTNKYGYFLTELASTGRYFIGVRGTTKRIYLSSKGARVNIKIHR